MSGNFALVLVARANKNPQSIHGSGWVGSEF